MKNNLLNKAIEAVFNKKVNSFGYLPRWIIFSIDIGILIFANLLTYIMLTNLDSTFYNLLNVFERYGLIICVNIVFFIFFRTYAGIIRHSSFIDAVKLLFSTFTSLVALVIINYISYFVSGEKIFLVPGLILSFVLSFTFLFFFRIIVKFVFESLINKVDSKKLTPTVVYGSDANAIAVANAIKSESPPRFKVVAFMDNSKANKSKSILGLPILYNSKKISVIMRSYRANALIIAEKSLSKEDKISIIDDCLEHNIKVYTIPIITNWENEKEISKQIKSFQIEDLLERKPIVLDNKLVSSQLSGKTVLITGAAGSIGSEIVWQVLEFSPKKLIIIDQAETPLHHISLEIEKSQKKVKVITIISDIRNKASLEKVFEQYKPDVVFHAAAYKHVPLMENNPCQAIYTNVLGTKNVADLAVYYGAKKFVMVSTDKAVNPSNVMGASKRIAEKYVQALHYKNATEKAHDTKFITTRFGNVLGSNGSVVPLFKKQIESGGPITITHPEIIRYFMTIPEACQLVLEAGGMGNGGEIYIFDMGKPVKIIDLARKMIQLAGYEPDKEIEIKVIGLRPGEKLYEELLNDTSKTLPTHHEKIMIAQEEEADFDKIIVNTDQLITIATCQNEVDIVQYMKKIVPEFKSLNSTYEMLD
ncbi:nucleoside-diphosphate sugar epimerase/dehydratase [Flavobacterium gelidilacus]|uniref:polysaccharide biosynthesis protein n=1 Tax=Flavobacterium gelidilacus TaxID=206041 RepID=UPI00047D466E